MTIPELEQKCLMVRQEVFKMITRAKSGHIGGAYSKTELLVAMFYGGILKYDAKQPLWPERDYFILSAAHSCESLYVCMADCGYFHPAFLEFYGADGAMLGGHPSKKIPGIEYSGGSLGHGLGVATGIAYALKLQNKPNQVYCLIGDGDLMEGSTWEAIMFAGQHELNNLIVFVDLNQEITLNKVNHEFLVEGTSGEDETYLLDHFGWCQFVEEKGNEMKEVLKTAQLMNIQSGRPVIGFFKTTKGKGTSVTEGVLSHHMIPNKDQIEIMKKELKLI